MASASLLAGETPLATDPKTELRTRLQAVLEDAAFHCIRPDDRATLAVEAIWKWAFQQPSDSANRGKPWSDAQLRVVLGAAPTHANIVRLAHAFQRSPGSIEQIYRWAATTDKKVKERRPDDSFVAQVKRIAKEVGWEAF